MADSVTGDAGIRQGEKFTEDALAQTCEALLETNRKMQTALDLQDSELRELWAARAGLIQKVEDQTKQLAERRVPWVAAMAAEINSHSKNTALTIKQAVAEAAAIYAETEKIFGG